MRSPMRNYRSQQILWYESECVKCVKELWASALSPHQAWMNGCLRFAGLSPAVSQLYHAAPLRKTFNWLRQTSLDPSRSGHTVPPAHRCKAESLVVLLRRCRPWLSGPPPLWSSQACHASRRERKWLHRAFYILPSMQFSHSVFMGRWVGILGR